MTYKQLKEQLYRQYGEDMPIYVGTMVFTLREYLEVILPGQSSLIVIKDDTDFSKIEYDALSRFITNWIATSAA